MKRKVLLAMGLVLGLSIWADAQSVPLPPTPVAESDLRDNTIKMRSIDLERVKRDAAKIRPEDVSREQEIRFEQTKENFESIQKLQDSIIKAYTTGKTIDYSRIRKSASDISKKSLWLDRNLFGTNPEEAIEAKQSKTGPAAPKSVRDLIIELDNAIGVFVKSPIFQNTKVVDLEISKAAQLELRHIMRVSELLSIEAAKMQ